MQINNIAYVAMSFKINLGLVVAFYDVVALALLSNATPELALLLSLDGSHLSFCLRDEMCIEAPHCTWTSILWTKWP
jgi:hypothetical protein